MTHVFDPTLLREYDIRGVVGDTLSADDARAIGRSFGTLVARAGGKRVAVGYDGRLSSPMLEAAVVEGLNAVGVDALRVGLGPTPMLYYASATEEVAGGIQITGSHNPPDYNGFKMVFGDGPSSGRTFSGSVQWPRPGTGTSVRALRSRSILSMHMLHGSSKGSAAARFELAGMRAMARQVP
jgi:Phosphomannomutase